MKLLVSHGESIDEPEESSLLKSVERHGDWTAGGQGISQVFLFDPHRHVTSSRNYRCFIEGILLIPRRAKRVQPLYAHFLCSSEQFW